MYNYCQKCVYPIFAVNLDIDDEGICSACRTFEEIVNLNCSHKRRVKPEILDKLAKTYEIVDIEMEEGDVLFFNHLLVHGSPNNLSPKSRLSALMQFYDAKLSFEPSYFDNYSSYRAKFVQNWLTESLEKVNQYKKNLLDFKKN